MPLMSFRENVLYQQIMLDYFMSKIENESNLIQELNNNALSAEFVYKKAAFVSVSVKEFVNTIRNSVDLADFFEVIFDQFYSDNYIVLPLYCSVNDIKICVLSLDDINFEKKFDKFVENFFELLKERFGAKAKLSIKSVFATLKELKLNFYSLFFENSAKLKSDANTVLKAKMYIEKNYMNKLTLDDIARHLGVTSYYFCRMFKKETGINFASYLTEVRINQAKKLLKETKLSNRQICEKVGINSTNYFHQLFKNFTSLTPSEYRSSHEK